MKHFITFGMDHTDNLGRTLGYSYLVVEGEDYTACRKAAFEARGAEWAFIYPIRELEVMKKKYRLTEVDIDAVKKTYD